MGVLLIHARYAAYRRKAHAWKAAGKQTNGERPTSNFNFEVLSGAAAAAMLEVLQEEGLIELVRYELERNQTLPRTEEASVAVTRTMRALVGSWGSLDWLAI